MEVRQRLGGFEVPAHLRLLSVKRNRCAKTEKVTALREPTSWRDANTGR
ncbi:hypothetical protein AVTE2539_02585 [Acidovorax sp. SUPP2539]|nr:hypothetical protein AVTE2539_02585 [Acidovorax sp. SUPP2539]